MRRVRKLQSPDMVRWFVWEIMWQTWCHMLKVTHRHVFVSQKVCRHPYFSVKTRAWTRLVVEHCVETCRSSTNMGNKLCDKLYRETSSYVKIYTRWRLVSKNLYRGTPFHSEHASQSFVLVKPMFSDMVLYVKSYILRRVRKLRSVHGHRFDCVY